MEGIDFNENKLKDEQCAPYSLLSFSITEIGISSFPINLRHATYTSELPDLLVPGTKKYIHCVDKQFVILNTCKKICQRNYHVCSCIQTCVVNNGFVMSVHYEIPPEINQNIFKLAQGEQKQQ